MHGISLEHHKSRIVRLDLSHSICKEIFQIWNSEIEIPSHIRNSIGFLVRLDSTLESVVQ